jgi:hypothetical protein
LNAAASSLIGAALILLGLACANDTSRAETGGSVSVVRNFTGWTGTGSCAASACHNANSAEGTKGGRYAKGGEYSVWLGKDPHAKAYTVLFQPLSQRIQQSLDPRGFAHKNLLCLRCHVDPAVDQVTEEPPVSFHDGVGCESCHGGAKNWLEPHVRAAWKPTEDNDKAKLGFRLTKNLTVRVETCLACHVGSDRAEVNHDLLAAGHPPLQFEFSDSLERYRAFQHWNEADDRRRNPDHEAKAWSVGQAAVPHAALQLLSNRAAHADTKPWPEFAEYACSSCHHNLDQTRTPSAAGKLGSPPWMGVGRVAALLRDSATADDARTDGLLGALRLEMGKRSPDSHKVADQANELANAFDEWIAAHPVDKPLNAEEVRNRMRRFTAQKAEQIVRGGWDDALQLSFALNAHSRSLQALEGRRNPLLSDAVKRLSDRLGVPKGQYTPKEYDAERVISDLKAIRDQIGTR